jgi:hypothetical protein
MINFKTLRKMLAWAVIMLNLLRVLLFQSEHY